MEEALSSLRNAIIYTTRSFVAEEMLVLQTGPSYLRLDHCFSGMGCYRVAQPAESDKEQNAAGGAHNRTDGPLQWKVDGVQDCGDDQQPADRSGEDACLDRFQSKENAADELQHCSDDEEREEECWWRSCRSLAAGHEGHTDDTQNDIKEQRG